MLRFDLGQARQWAAMMLVIQVMMGAGIAVMYRFFYDLAVDGPGLYGTSSA
jgi:hypothetical protein